jgi:uncharacterized protein (DUF2384 family)
LNPPAAADEQTAAKPGGRRTMTFRRHNAPRLTPEQKRRQSDVLGHAWRHFGASAPVIAFLNARHDQLNAQPLHLALESDEGLLRVERLLETMTLQA